MPGLGHLPEFLAIMVVALIVFGPGRLPEVGSTIGKGIREFRRASSELGAALTYDAASSEEEGYPLPTASEESQSPPLEAVGYPSTLRARRRRTHD